MFLLLRAGVAQGETVGDARQLSRLGEPLRLAIPVRADGGPPLVDRCIAIAAPPQSDGLPHILTANVAVEREAATGTIVVTTPSPVREPVVRLLLRTGCDGSARQYTLFLEPPGSTRQIRAVAQTLPRIAASGPAISTGTAGRDVPSNPPSTAAPLVTVIPVIPTARPANEATALKGNLSAKGPTSASSDRPRVTGVAPVPSAGGSDTRPGPRRAGANDPPRDSMTGTAPQPAAAAFDAKDNRAVDAAALEAENVALREQLARMNDELQRLQHAPAAMPTSGVPAPVTPAPRAVAQPTASAPPRWEAAWPVLVALVGLASLVAGGFMWRRRQHAADDWALTGPPSHRVASRTSLAEEPVTFKQAGVRGEGRSDERALGDAAAMSADAKRTSSFASPLPLLIQPSTEDLARELEQEIFVAERAHSALERAHPEIVDVLTRSWGTAAARNHLQRLLDGGSVDLARMSGEALAELRLLLRVADDPTARNGDARAAMSPSTPAW
ncbi:MAG: hypothetical protein M3Z31_03620 [Pseudomonadota bacterium]|nr:hypothetical protein [Pseudomonadota bacterium]